MAALGDPTSLCSLARRHRVLPLVCQRWRQLVHSPPLLETVEVYFDYEDILLQRLRSLCEWLLRHAAPHVRQLELTALSHVGPEDQAEAAAMLSGMLVACNRLTHLGLKVSEMDVPVGAWLAALSGLRSLRIASLSPVRVTAQLHTLTALTRLDLAGSGTVIAPQARLPPSVSTLLLALGPDSTAMEPQVGPAAICLHTVAGSRP